jgi:hypothetical protein
MMSGAVRSPARELKIVAYLPSNPAGLIPRQQTQGLIPSIVTFCCKLLHINSKVVSYLLDFVWTALALAVHIFMEDHKATVRDILPFRGAHCDFCNH